MRDSSFEDNTICSVIELSARLRGRRTFRLRRPVERSPGCKRSEESRFTECLIACRGSPNLFSSLRALPRREWRREASAGNGLSVFRPAHEFHGRKNHGQHDRRRDFLENYDGQPPYAELQILADGQRALETCEFTAHVLSSAEKFRTWNFEAISLIEKTIKLKICAEL